MTSYNEGLFYFDPNGGVRPEDDLLLLDLPQDKKLVIYLYYIDEPELSIAVVNADICTCRDDCRTHRHIIRSISHPLAQTEIDDLFSYMDELA